MNENIKRRDFIRYATAGAAILTFAGSAIAESPHIGAFINDLGLNITESLEFVQYRAAHLYIQHADIGGKTYYVADEIYDLSEKNLSKYRRDYEKAWRNTLKDLVEQQKVRQQILLSKLIKLKTEAMV